MEALEARLGYTFRDRRLLENALMHSSYANENRARGYTSNERLEFLGDSVLGMVTATRLYQLYPDMPEGKMSRLRAELVCEQALHGVALTLHLGDYIRLGHGEERAAAESGRPSLPTRWRQSSPPCISTAARACAALYPHAYPQRPGRGGDPPRRGLQDRAAGARAAPRRADAFLYRLRRERPGPQQDVHHGRAAQRQRNRPRHRPHEKGGGAVRRRCALEQMTQ